MNDVTIDNSEGFMFDNFDFLFLKRNGFKLVCCVLIAVSALASACYRQDVQTFTISTPQMKNRECADIIAEAARSCKGIQEVEFDIEDKSVQVTYNSLMLAEKNVETAIARAGFDANSILAFPAARGKLPDKLK